MIDRPKLNAGLSAVTFAEHYWLRVELADFCRASGLSSAGSKRELAARIAAFLSGEALPPVQRTPAPKRMPVDFTRETPIEQGWRCSQALRAFISAEIGRPFHFDRFMREQIGSGSGALLGAVIEAWLKQEGRRHEIEPQFEYNSFTREYWTRSPKATRSEVIAAWRRYRALPASRRPAVAQMAREWTPGA